jgi:hypothetical protein
MIKLDMSGNELQVGDFVMVVTRSTGYTNAGVGMVVGKYESTNECGKKVAKLRVKRIRRGKRIDGKSSSPPVYKLFSYITTSDFRYGVQKLSRELVGEETVAFLERE